MTEPKDAKPRDKTTNWAEYNASLKARGSLTIWLDKDMRVQWPYRASTTALDLLVDSTGIQFLGKGEWKRKKHGAEYRRQWRKVHLGIDANTQEIRAIEASDNSVGDAPMLAEWLGQIPLDDTVVSVSGDGAYNTKANHRLVRSIWTKWSGYHRRGLAETKTHGFKRLGERVMARKFERQVVGQVVGLHVRVAPFNRFTQLGRPTTVPVAAMA
jgi:hypothetical protein